MDKGISIKSNATSDTRTVHEMLRASVEKAIANDQPFNFITLETGPDSNGMAYAHAVSGQGTLPGLYGSEIMQLARCMLELSRKMSRDGFC